MCAISKSIAKIDKKCYHRPIVYNRKNADEVIKMIGISYSVMGILAIVILPTQDYSDDNQSLFLYVKV